MESEKNKTKDCLILVIEDDPGIRETLEFALEWEGYRVETAANGREGLRLLASFTKPDLILLDLMMPEMNGWEFYRELQLNPNFRSIPVVVLTAFDGQTEQLTAQGVLKKPIQLNTLSQMAHRWCDPMEKGESKSAEVGG